MANITPRREFEQVFGEVNADQWYWLKDFVQRNESAGPRLADVVGYRLVATGRTLHPDSVEPILNFVPNHPNPKETPMALTPEEINNRFGFHKAAIEGPNATKVVHTVLRAEYKTLATKLNDVLSDSREARLAMEALEVASMWSHKAIAKTAYLADKAGALWMHPDNIASVDEPDEATKARNDWLGGSR